MKEDEDSKHLYIAEQRKKSREKTETKQNVINQF